MAEDKTATPESRMFEEHAAWTERINRTRSVAEATLADGRAEMEELQKKLPRTILDVAMERAAPTEVAEMKRRISELEDAITDARIILEQLPGEQGRAAQLSRKAKRMAEQRHEYSLMKAKMRQFPADDVARRDCQQLSEYLGEQEDFRSFWKELGKSD